MSLARDKSSGFSRSDAVVFALVMVVVEAVLGGGLMMLGGCKRRPGHPVDTSEPVSPMIDPDFGKISFCGEVTGIWQTHHDIEDPEHHAKYGFGSIPGDRNGPSPSARAFLLQKKRELVELWRICTPALVEVCERWSAKGLAPPVTEQFLLAAIDIDEDFESSGCYEVGFDSAGRFGLYVAVRVRNDKVEGWTCDT